MQPLVIHLTYFYQMKKLIDFEINATAMKLVSDSNAAKFQDGCCSGWELDQMNIDALLVVSCSPKHDNKITINQLDLQWFANRFQAVNKRLVQRTENHRFRSDPKIVKGCSKEDTMNALCCGSLNTKWRITVLRLVRNERMNEKFQTVFVNIKFYVD